MAVIKNNINFGNQNIKRIYKGNNQITQIWRKVNNQNKLLYFYGDGSQGLTYEIVYDDVQEEKTFRQLSTSSKIGFDIEGGVLVYPASFSLVVTDTDGAVISIKDAVVTAPSAYEVSTPKIINTTITFTAYARQPSITIVADVKVTYTVRKNVDSTNLAVTGITEVESPLSPLNIPEHTFEFDDQNKIGTVVAIKDAALRDKDSTKISGAVTFPDTVRTIGVDAFFDCTGITQVTINANVTAIGLAAFACCPRLTDVFWYATNCTETGSGTYPIFGSYPDIGTTGLQDTVIKNVVIGDGVQTLPAYTFCGCKTLSRITIPNNVINVGGGLLESSGITAAYIGSGLQTISPYMFSNCDKLQDITLGNSVTQISEYAFQNCAMLRRVTIPTSLSQIQTNAFAGAVGVSSSRDVINFYLTGSTFQFWGKIKGIGNLMNPDKKPSSEVVVYKFFTNDGTEMKTVILGVGISKIEDYTFFNCTGLNSITLGSQTTAIGDNAFAGCTGIYSMTFSNVLTSIGAYAFYNCKHITSLDLPDSLKTIGNYAFLGTSITSLRIPDNTTIIPQGMVQNCTQLKTIDFPSTIAQLSRGFFYGAIKLNRINYPGSMAQWGQIQKDAGWKDSISEQSTITVYCNDGTVQIDPNIIT